MGIGGRKTLFILYICVYIMCIYNMYIYIYIKSCGEEGAENAIFSPEFFAYFHKTIICS